MSEPGEFVFVPRKLPVRDSVTQIDNDTSKSGASIQSRTALNAGETENSLTDRLEEEQQREHKDMRDFWIPEQVQDDDFSIKKEKNCAKAGKKPIGCFSTAMFFKLQDWYSTSPWIPHSTTR